MIVSITICLSHAHTSFDLLSGSSTSVISTDSLNDNTPDINISETSCGSYCNHHVLDLNGDIDIIDFFTKPFIFNPPPLILGKFQYPLLRPPKA